MYTEQEAIQYVRENDVRFIKLFFTDFYGSIKSISIQPSELERAFAKGIPFDASSVKGFLGVAKSDLFIVPDPSTLAVLPWRPQSGRVVRFFCSIRYPDGTPFEVDTRKILSNIVEKAREQGFDFTIGTKCEFYLFKCDEKGNPTKEPYDTAGYCDLAPRDKGENVRREICLTLEQMGVHPETSHHEKGPGQNEVDFICSDVINAADNLQTFKIVVKTIAARNGLFASFLPKPLPDKPGNGLHINISLYKDGKNLFAGEELSEEAKSFVAGILFHALEISPFTNPIPNSYMRLGSCEAPKYISWSRQNRSQLVRIPDSDENAARMEFRASDPAGNPYVDLYLLLAAGLEGIKKHYELPDPTDIDPYNADPEDTRFMIRLPMSLNEAKKYCEKGDFIYKIFPEMLIDFLTSPDNDFSGSDIGEV